MASESEILLRAAARIAAAERGAGSSQQDTVSIHVTIKDSKAEYVVDTGGGEVTDASTAAVSRARLHLVYATEEVFLALAHKRMDPRVAMLTGKISLKGEMALGIKLGYWIREAVTQGADVAGALENVRLEMAERDKWEKDEDAEVCAVCRQGFKLYRRRHHCRYCGRVVCQDCSASKIGGQRACDPCLARASTAPAATPPSVAKTNGGGGEEGARELQSRVMELEEEVENLDKRAFTARARVLRQLVLMVYRVIALTLLAAVLLSAHFSAGLLSRHVGPSVFEVAIDVTPLSSAASSSRARLSSAIGGAANTAKSMGLGLSRSAETGSTSNASAASEEDQEEGGSTGQEVSAAVAGGRGDSGEMDIGFISSSSCGNDGACAGEEECSEDSTSSSPGPVSSPAPIKLNLSLSVYWTVMLVVVICLSEHQRRTEGLILRRIKTFCLAGTVIGTLKMTRKLTQDMSPDESEDTWSDVHKLLAPFVYQSILDVAGMWVKTGQYLSSRADIMPQPYIDELSKCQDSVPASPYDEVDETVKEQLGRSLTELFASVNREALASASVAQVHCCTLKDGRKAVVKVQHRRVRQLFLEDLKNISRLVRLVAWAEKDYDFRPVMNEWTSESYKELDFFCEAKNLLRIGKAMKRSGLAVIVPELVPEFTRMKVVVMTFCEGFKVTDAKALAAAELDREGVMRAVTESFAYQQIHMDGLFNGDPHPGNILLQPILSPPTSSDGAGVNNAESKSAMPVLLDWGLAKTLPEHLRIAFSRFIYAGCEHDFVSMLVAFEEMGVKLNRFDPAEDMHNIRFLLRDSQPASEAKKDVIQFHRRIAKKRSRGLKNPVDAYPGDLLFFLRVHALLRGLATRLQVRQRYMEIMAPYAKQALREVVPVAERATHAVYPSPVLSRVEAKVRKALEEMVEREQITGCQVCVIYRGQTLVDLCAGTQGPVDPRPVKPTTLFCAFSAGKAVCSTAVHILADRGLLQYDQRLAELWPEFACNGKETTTVRHVLTHSTGLQHAFPDKATFDKFCDWDETKKMLEEAEPAWPPGFRASYHYFTFGWLVAAVVEKASGVPFEKFIREEMAIPLGLEDSFFMGGLSAYGVDPTRIASVEHTFKIPGRSAAGKAAQPMPSAAESGSEKQPAAGVKSGSGSDGGSGRRKDVSMVGPEPSSELRQGAAGDDEIVGSEDIEEDVDDEGAPRLGLLATMASALKETDPEEGAAIDGLARRLAGREYFLDPRVFNYPQVRDACIPAANGHFTAKALAMFYDNILGSLGLSGSSKKTKKSGHEGPGRGTGTGVVKPAPLLRRARVNEMRAYQVKETSSLHLLFGLPMGGVRYSLGYQMFGFREKPRQHQQSPSAEARSSVSTITTRTGAGGAVAGTIGSGTFFTRAASTLLGGAASIHGGRGIASTVGGSGGGGKASSVTAPPARGRVRLSGLGHVGMGGSVALCDPASGLAFAMVTNKVASGRASSSAVLSLVCEELGIGDPSHFFED
ncbi:unnamed protein product [Scytosiphon promiscuus]